VRSQLSNFMEASKAYSSLATGSDQVFAEAAINLEIPVVAVLPFEGYERYFRGSDLADYGIAELGPRRAIHGFQRHQKDHSPKLGNWPDGNRGICRVASEDDRDGACARSASQEGQVA
jgi:hypothetical protein